MYTLHLHKTIRTVAQKCMHYFRIVGFADMVGD